MLECWIELLKMDVSCIYVCCDQAGGGGNRRQLVLSGLGGVRGDLVGYQSLIMAQTEMIFQSEMLMPTNPPVQKRWLTKGGPGNHRGP